MSDTGGGFTLLDDRAAAELGLVRAAVLAAVLRHQRMRDGACRASMERIADLLGIHRATVIRHIQALVGDGYLSDATPDCRHAPHVHKLTPKAWRLFEAQEGDTSEAEVSQSATPERPTDVGEVSHDAIPRCSTAHPQVSHPAQEVSQVATQGTLEEHNQNTIQDHRGGAQAPPPARVLSQGNGKLGEPQARAPVPAAVKAYRSATRLYPPKTWYERIAHAVGDSPPDLERWREMVTEWIGKGWSPRNVAGMLDAWQQGGINPLPGRRATRPGLGPEQDADSPAGFMTDAAYYLEHALAGVD